jgi:hypothetical protein
MRKVAVYTPAERAETLSTSLLCGDRKTEFIKQVHKSYDLALHS